MHYFNMRQRRPPRGGRGLKYCIVDEPPQGVTSPPSRGAWIEIWRGAVRYTVHLESPPSRGAWIEIPVLAKLYLRFWVAPLAGGVD